MVKKDYKIPFDDKGNQLHYEWYSYQNGEWRDNEEFNDTLVYKGYARGRSAAYFLFHRASTQTEVVVFMTDFEKMIPLLTYGFLSGTFTYTKRGQNYGVKLV